MIPLIDVSFTKFLKTNFPDYSVVFAPNELARKRISTEVSQETTNLPGLSIWRTGIEYDMSRINRPTEHDGHFKKYTNVLGTLYAKTHTYRKKYVSISYEVSSFSYKLTERNDIERILAFLDIYQTIQFRVESMDYYMTFVSSAPSYSYELEDRNDKIRYYSLTQNYTVYGFWVLGKEFNTILKVISNIYEIMSSGDPVSTELLDTITIIPA
jgi:hypothetical protein